MSIEFVSYRAIPGSTVSKEEREREYRERRAKIEKSRREVAEGRDEPRDIAKRERKKSSMELREKVLDLFCYGSSPLRKKEKKEGERKREAGGGVSMTSRLSWVEGGGGKEKLTSA